MVLHKFSQIMLLHKISQIMVIHEFSQITQNFPNYSIKNFPKLWHSCNELVMTCHQIALSPGLFVFLPAFLPNLCIPTSYCSVLLEPAKKAIDMILILGEPAVLC